MKRLTIFSFLYFLYFALSAQTKKQVDAYPISSALIIDAVLDEQVYKTSKPAIDFIQIQPYNGQASFQPTEVYFFFDQTAIYIGGFLYEEHPDSIYNYLTERDNIGMSDYFGVYLDPYNQGQLAFGFFLTPSGVQIDIKALKKEDDVEDGNWNAVWESKTKILSNGWSFEMKIPYSALRFPKHNNEKWGVNIFRNIRRLNSNNSWNFIDRKVSGFIHQEGELNGIKNIVSPVRLSLSPYLTTYFEPKNNVGNEKNQFLYKGGLDLKYGINDAFTLDMMLIPDFGQIQSDDKKLNLSPYELYHDEKRQFFTEGTELFQRGDVFYSRRIGSSPKFSADGKLSDNETIDYNPSETQLINATKVSGRSDKGWGLGVLNAMSLSSNAIIVNSNTGLLRNINVQPFTNYNVTAIDKSLKNNSYISFINTNVSMVNNPFYANVTATEFQFRDKTKTYALKGKGGISVRENDGNETGYYSSLGLEKSRGKMFWGLKETVYSDKYNPNDLGYLQKNNLMNTEVWLYYQIIDPFWILRECNGDIWFNYNRIYNPNTFYDRSFGYDLFFRFKNNYSFSSSGQITSNQFDYYEPRVKGRFYLNPQKIDISLNLQTDNRKLLNFTLYYELASQSDINHFENNFELNSNLRLGQRFNISHNFSTNNSSNEYGFVKFNENKDSICFAKRNVLTYSNTISTSYIINNKASLSCRARHYWSGVKNSDFYLLQENGKLKTNPEYNENNNQNYNAFTIDLILRWIFAPGSEFSMAWKTFSNLNEDLVEDKYSENLMNSWKKQSSSISVKILYYIDYNSLRKKSN